MKLVVNVRDARKAIISAMDRIQPIYPKGHEYDSACEDCSVFGAEDETTLGYLNNALNKLSKDRGDVQDVAHDLIVANTRLQYSAMRMNMEGDAERAFKAHEDIESAFHWLFEVWNTRRQIVTAEAEE